jgi:hypothetical protein
MTKLSLSFLMLLLMTSIKSSAQIGKLNQDTSKCFGYTELKYIAVSLVEGRTCDTLLGIAKTKLANRDSTIKELNIQKSKLQVQSDLKDALLKMKDDDNKLLAKDLKRAQLNLKLTKFGWAATAVLLSATATYFAIR